MGTGFSALAGIPSTALQHGPEPDYQAAHENMADTMVTNYETGQEKADANAKKPVDKIVTTFGDDGTPSYDFHGVSERTKEWLTEMATIGTQTKKAFDEAVNYSQAKRKFLDENPIVGSLGRIAAGAAASYQNPHSGLQGIVRGAGAYGMGVFGQSSQELAEGEAGMRSHEVAALAPIANEQLAAEREDRAYRVDAQRERHRIEREHDRDLAEADATAAGAVRDARMSGAYEPGTIFAQAKQRGLTDAQAYAWEERGLAAAQAYAKAKKEDDAHDIEKGKALAKAQGDRAVDVYERELKLAQQYGQDPKTAAKLGDITNISGKYNAALTAKNDAVSQVSELYHVFQGANAVKFHGNKSISPEQAFDAVFGALGSGEVKTVNEKGEYGTATVKSILATYLQIPEDEITGSEMIKFRAGLQQMRKDYRSFGTLGPQLESQHEFLRQSLPESVRGGLLSLKPKANAPIPPTPAGAAPTSPAPPPPVTPAAPKAIGSSSRPNGRYPTKDGKGYVEVRGGLVYPG